jgi:nucleoside-diphosphate-sugar epimerase
VKYQKEQKLNRLIVGCGFLGFPLARKWAETSNTYATTRSDQRAEEFRNQGISPVICDITDSASVQDAVKSLPQMNNIVFAVGMDRSRYSDIRDVYVKGLQRFFEAWRHPIPHFIYISSTGVFGNFDGQWIDESAATAPSREGGKACLEAEKLIAETTDNWTVLRMAGLYGGQRVPTRQIVQKKDWGKLSPAGYLNLIHQTDAVNAIMATADEKPMRQIIHCSDGNPPVRKDYYQYIADQVDLGPIPWPENSQVDTQSRSANSKRIGNQKMLHMLGLKLVHPDFKSGLADVF